MDGKTDPVEDFFGPPISIYTRRQAINDGVLVDVTPTAREAGFRCPVAVTHAVWADYVAPDQDDRELGQSEAGRLWDVLMLLRHVAARATDGAEVRLPVAFVLHGHLRTVKLKAVAGPGDDGELVVTVMLPDED